MVFTLRQHTSSASRQERALAPPVFCRKPQSSAANRPPASLADTAVASRAGCSRGWRKTPFADALLGGFPGGARSSSLPRAHPDDAGGVGLVVSAHAGLEVAARRLE